jgi:hypothetical protein
MKGSLLFEKKHTRVRGRMKERWQGKGDEDGLYNAAKRERGSI